MSVPVSAQMSLQTPCSPAATPTLSTYAASAGSWVGTFEKVTNCSSRKKRLTVVFTATSACGVETVFASSRIVFNGGDTKIVSATYVISPDTCLGACTVNVSVYDGGVLLGGASTTLTIQ